MSLTENIEKIDQAIRNLTDRTRRFKYVILGVVVICGLVMRLVAWHNDPVVSRDGVIYLQAAKSSKGNSNALKHYTQGPLLLKAIQIFHGAGLAWEHAGVTVNLAAGTLLILAVFWATKELFPGNGLCAFVAALLVAFNPKLVMLSHEVQRESLYLLFSALALAAIFRAARTSSWQLWLISGVFAAFAASSRFEALELLLFAPLAVWFLGDRTVGKARFLKMGCIFISTAVCILILYSWFDLPLFRFVDSVKVRIANIF